MCGLAPGMPALLVCFAAVLIPGCILSDLESPDRETTLSGLALGDTLQIAFDDTLVNSDENIWLTFDSLGADSRCPVDVTCVWEGNAELGFVFGRDAETGSFVLNTSATLPTRTKLWTYDIALIEVLPVSHSDSVFMAEDYSATLLITKTD